MTKKIMLINETDDEIRIAIIEDNLLQEMLIEHRTKEQIKNNIYKGEVVQLQTSLQAAFVDFGSKKHGFLPNSEINVNMLSNRNASVNAPIQRKLKEGQSVLVQVTKEAVDQKGAALTTNVMLPGRFMVLMPYSNKGGISKKIEDADERDRLKSFLSGIDSEEHAVIIRTAGQDRSLMELKKDYTALKKTWEETEKNFDNLDVSGLVLDEPDVISRTLRDYYTEELSEIWVDHPETFQKVLQFLKQTSPRKQKNLKLFVGDRSLFSTYKIERQVEQLTPRDVKLKSGGSIVIDQTEALVAIDVNSGKSNQEGDLDATALRTNMEAAKEIARQLRLRNLGGLIVIDFIDMENESANRKVEDELRSAMDRDKAQRKFNPISQFGLLELSRQRLNIGISKIVESDCPTCNGKGKIPSLLASTNLILRSIRETAAKGNLIKIEGDLPLELANHLLNERRQSITDLELEFGINIVLRGDPKMVVFDESFLEPTYIEKPSETTAKKDTQKQEASKKKHRRRDKQSTRKSTDQTGKEAKHVEEKQQKQAEETPKSEPKKKKELVENDQDPKPEKEKETKQESKAVSDERLNNDSPIHPHALFSNVRELEGEELEEVKSGFENRIKGKSAEATPRSINKKYLWDFQNGTEPELETVDAESIDVDNEVSAASFDVEPLFQDSADDQKDDSDSVLEYADFEVSREESTFNVADSSDAVNQPENDKKENESKSKHRQQPAKQVKERKQSGRTAKKPAKKTSTGRKSTSKRNAVQEDTKKKSSEKDTREKSDVEKKAKTAVDKKSTTPEKSEADAPAKKTKKATRAKKQTGTKKAAENAASAEPDKKRKKPVQKTAATKKDAIKTGKSASTGRKRSAKKKDSA